VWVIEYLTLIFMIYLTAMIEPKITSVLNFF
jgi:hypothetical protein